MAAADTDPRTRPIGSGRLTGVRWWGAATGRLVSRPASRRRRPSPGRLACARRALRATCSAWATVWRAMAATSAVSRSISAGACPVRRRRVREICLRRRPAARERSGNRVRVAAPRSRMRPTSPLRVRTACSGRSASVGWSISASMNRSSRGGRRPWRVRRGGVWPAEAAARPRRVAAERPRKAPQAPWALGRSSSSFCHDATALQEHLPAQRLFRR
jgi:hypothetical protein